MNLRLTLVALAALSALSSFAVEFRVEGINGQVLVKKRLRKVDLTKSVGQITVETLTKKFGVDSDKFEADVVSVTEIAGLRTSTSRYSDGSVRAFGWCYQINGVVPDALADEIRLSSQNDVLRWYYGSISYSPGTGWESECRPVLSYGVY